MCVEEYNIQSLWSNHPFVYFFKIYTYPNNLWTGLIYCNYRMTDWNDTWLSDSCKVTEGKNNKTVKSWLQTLRFFDTRCVSNKRSSGREQFLDLLDQRSSVMTLSYSILHVFCSLELKSPHISGRNELYWRDV